MDPNDPNDQKKKAPTDKEIKEAARNGRPVSNRPGVVSMSEAAALDQRIAEKTRSSATSGAPAPGAPQELSQLERDISSKHKNAPGFAAATPGAYSSAPSAARADLSNFESDVAAKQRARAPNVTAIEGLDRKVAAKVASSPSSSAVGNRELQDLEASVQAKVNANTRRGDNDNSTQQYNSHTAYGAKPASRDDLARLDERIAAKNGSAVPRSLQETEDIVSKKKTNTGAVLGETQTAPPEKRNLPEQSPQPSKESRLESHPQGLQAHGDVEYGEFGGPTEQGLAVAFAVEEETEDAFIPAAIEYDPDAKPPLIKNRRFRLYAFLAVVAVVVGTISAAVGITLAGKKKTYDEITDRFTSGVRQAVESLVGAEKLVDPSSPYFKAMDWIENKDPLQLVPSDGTFVQRYILALFYYSTSEKREWMAGCAPAASNETDDCIYSRLLDITVEQGNIVQKIPSVRWLSGETECAWAGVQCTGDRPEDVKHVRSIALSGANMTGTIPSELLQLNLLQHLTLRFNEFPYALPEYLTKFRHLVKLDLHQNQFTGTIPTSFFTNPVLSRLDLSRNKLTGTIPTNIGRFIDSKELLLGYNQLTGSLPTEMGRLHSLTTIWVQVNRLNGTLPTEMGNMESLNNAIFHENQFTGGLPSTIGGMTYLGDFKVSDNKLKGTLPSGLYTLSTLYTLDLSNNEFTGTISDAIGNIKFFDNLLLKDNDFSGTIPSVIGILPMIDNFQISGNRFNGSMPLSTCPAERGAQKFKLFRKLIADCLPGADGSPPEFECQCCTVCCDRDTSICEDVAA